MGLLNFFKRKRTTEKEGTTEKESSVETGPKDTYTSSVDFIDQLDFDHAETYSFQRGKDFERNEKLLRSEYEVLKRKRRELTTDEDGRLQTLKTLLRTQNLLLDKNGQFHPSSQKTGTFKWDDPIIDRLREILTTEIVYTLAFMCPPVYRDAIVFYDSENRIVTTLNVCLGCNDMTTGLVRIEGDSKTYDGLKQFFLDFGHDVESH